MVTFNYKEYDALGLAELVHKKELTPLELVESAIEEIEAKNPNLNAVIHKMYEQAKRQVELPMSGPFQGIPMLLKDITQEIKGEPITSGSKALQGYVAKEDSVYVSKLRNAGITFLGQTNVPEYALMGITEPDHYGPTRNPWNTDYTPGGSSGGSAAAVASGMVPIAGANDGGGSIRIPAAYCGLFGLKPTRGRTPVGPRYGRHWQGASAEHILSRTVRDSAALLDILKGYEKGAAFHTLPFEESYLEQVKAPKVRKLKIAYSVQSPLGTEVEDDCKKAVYQAVKILEDMGHEVEEKGPPVDGRKMAKSYLSLYFGEVTASLAELETTLGRKAKASDVEPTTWLLGLIGRATSARDFVLDLREWDYAAYQMEEFHETYDLLVTPTTAFTQAKIGELDLKSTEKLLISLTSKLKLVKALKKLGVVDQIAETSLKRTPFTQLANLTGQPAMSVPLYQTAEGLPVGVQFIAARGKEDLYRLAALLEQTNEWLDIHKCPNY